MIKVLHFATDDKFVDMAIDVFNMLPECNSKLVVFSKNEPVRVKSNIDFIARGDFSGLMEEVFESDILIFHSLNPVWFDFINKLAIKKKLIWLGWGYDYYDIIGRERDFILPKTRKVISGDTANKIKRFLKRVYYKAHLKHKIIKKMDFFCPVISSEYELVQESFSKVGGGLPAFLDWNYGNMELHYGVGLGLEYCSGNNILVGNSATATNNHLDLLPILDKVEMEPTTKLILPISYGDTKYGGIVKVAYENKYKDTCIFLEDFLEYDSYIKILLGCEVVIMNHVRQQAVSNIVIMLYLGATVYLREENPVYRFLIELGVELYTIQSLVEGVKLSGNKLTYCSKERNRAIVCDYWGLSRNLSNTKKLISSAIEDEYA